jgi:adenylate cyclase
MILVDSDREKAIALVEDVFARHPDDKALENLLHRMHNLGEGNAYVLG